MDRHIYFSGFNMLRCDSIPSCVVSDTFKNLEVLSLRRYSKMISDFRSIRHLQDASSTDGKAASSLKKLRLFRQFYIMIVCYIYSTRIIVYLLKVTVPFQYVWLDEMFKETTTYIFYALTAYKFRPVPSHPYFAVDSDDEPDDEVEVWV